jgi:anti-sigma regulatory factor (Ser/Thr protein kinase)
MDRVAHHQLPLGADVASVAVARRYFTTVAKAAGVPSEVRDAGALAVSELVTNAVLHGCEPIMLQVTTLPRTVRVAVTDGSSHQPLPRPLGRPGRSERGRGLAIVADIAERWGCESQLQAPGKTVWCSFVVRRVNQGGCTTG